MTPDKLISPAEHKLFLVIAFLLGCLCFINITGKNIHYYNWQVEREQIEKRDSANNVEKLRFSDCSFGRPPVQLLVFGLQFLCHPLLFILFLKRTRARFIFSVLTTAFVFLGYADWLISSYQMRKSGAFFYIADTTFNTYLLYNSTVLEFILFLLFAVLLVLQLFVLSRFVIEKFQAKIYLR